MTIKEIIEEIFADRGPLIALFIVATAIIQISPIKINPWSAMIKWIGKHLNTDVASKVDGVEAKVDGLDTRIADIEERLNNHIADSEAADIRERRQAILDFASSLMRNTNYNREKFEFMMNECDSYQEYCRDNNIINGVADTSIGEIRRIYNERYRNNDFLIEQYVAPEGKKKSVNKEVV